MKKKMLGMSVAAALAAGSLLVAPAFAQDFGVGEQVNKRMNQNIHLNEVFLGGIPPEADHVLIKYLRMYVPGQRASGEIADPEDYAYYDLEGTAIEVRDVAKPLIGAFMYGPVDYPDQAGDENVGGFVGHGKRDAWAAVSLDDGDSWRTTNLSDSADKSSIELEDLEGDPLDYPGDVVNMALGVAGDKIVVAWPSRYCRTGSPAYSLTDEETEFARNRAAVADYLGIDLGSDLYLTDVFGVAGSQGFVDYRETEPEFPTVGQVPFNCVWTARGVLVEGDNPKTDGVEEAYHVVWYKPERLTSGRRDANRVELAMTADAGVAIVWQEDPDGLRSGRGLGPGEGWSGSTAHSGTDLWYSFLPWEHIETVIDENGDPVLLADYWDADAAQPKPYVPFAVPMRLTNNGRCGGTGPGQGILPYCEPTFGTDPNYEGPVAADFGLKEQCVDTVFIPAGPQGALAERCVSEDGIVNVGNTAATRARIALMPRLDDDGNTVGGWVVVVGEEDKGLGRYFFEVGETGVDTATPCTPPPHQPGPGDPDETCQEADVGKNVWYFSYDMGKPQTSADLSETGLVRNLVSQGNLLVQPETDWRTGEFFPPLDTADMWDFGDYNHLIHRTEYARRGSPVVQPQWQIAAGGGAVANRGNILAMMLYKQGLMQQGGPADIFGRRIINAGVSENPYDFAHMVCAETLYTDGSNPYYPKGICLDPAINLSATTPKDCAEGGGGEGDQSDGVCPTIDENGIASQNPEDQRVFDRLETWIQCPGSEECGTFAESEALGSNLDDQSWYNPLTVAKGHRGFMWQNMVMVMLANSPNWKLNRVGHDRNELYIRRSFDGGKTWTTTPSQWGGQGTTHCEFMRDGETTAESSQVCTEYAAGAPEQMRNVTQLSSQFGTPSNQETILDPRYAPEWNTMPTIAGDHYLQDFDEFNPTRFFVVYETGDNSTVIDGEAEALDLYYGRAVMFGDHYQVWADESDMVNTCHAEDDTAVPGFCNEFDRLTTGSNNEAEEANIVMTPSGNTLYSVWANFSHADPDPFPAPLSDARYARVWYLDPYPAWNAPSVPTGKPEPVMGGGAVPPGPPGGVPPAAVPPVAVPPVAVPPSR
jgi:hypothetical protein